MIDIDQFLTTNNECRLNELTGNTPAFLPNVMLGLVCPWSS